MEQNKERKVDVIWTDPLTQVRYESQVYFDVKLDFERMSNVVLSM